MSGVEESESRTTAESYVREGSRSERVNDLVGILSEIANERSRLPAQGCIFGASLEARSKNDNGC